MIATLAPGPKEPSPRRAPIIFMACRRPSSSPAHTVNTCGSISSWTAHSCADLSISAHSPHATECADLVSKVGVWPSQEEIAPQVLRAVNVTDGGEKVR